MRTALRLTAVAMVLLAIPTNGARVVGSDLSMSRKQWPDQPTTE